MNGGRLTTVYAITSGVLFLLAAIALRVYWRERERDRTGLWFAISSAAAGGTAVADAADPRLLPWLLPVTLATAAIATYLRWRGGSQDPPA
jgi:uncharacterized membrane protein YfcA